MAKQKAAEEQKHEAPKQEAPADLNKTQAILSMMAQLQEEGDANPSPKTLEARLADKYPNETFSIGLINVTKSKAKKKAGGATAGSERGNGRKPQAGRGQQSNYTETVRLDAIKAAKELLISAGSSERAKELIDLLS